MAHITGPTPYQHPFPNYQLNDLHQAMDYSSGGEPAIRVIAAGVGTSSATSITAFDEPVSMTLVPRVQVDALYGLDPDEIETFTAGGGSATTNTKKTLFVVESGTSAGGFEVLRSRKLLKYRPGQGANCRFTAMFSTPDSACTQRAGFFAQEQALNVGYNGTSFGILRANGGKAAIYTLTLSAAATGAQTATITLNSVTFTVSLVAGTTSENAVAIVNRAGGYTGWTVEQVNNTVRFLSNTLGPKAGTFSYSSSGDSTGSMAQSQAGVAQTDSWIPQESFNIDTLNGQGPSGVDIDWQKLNVFQINFRWLGAGEMRFAIENPETGSMIFFHHIHYSNQHEDVSLDNPSFKIGYIAANLSAGTATNVSVKGASMLMATEGDVTANKYPTGAVVTTSSLAANQVHNLISLRNQLIFSNKINLSLIRLKEVSCATNGNAPIVLYVFFRPQSFNTNFLWQNAGPSGNPQAVSYSTTTGTFTLANELIIYSDIIATDGSISVDLEDLALQIPPNNIMTLAVSSTGQINSIAGSVVWIQN